jgi:hypothetical protein
MTKRRAFLKSAGLSSLGLMWPGTHQTKRRISKTLAPATLSNGVVIDFISQNEDFLGIGAVQINNVAMRNAKRPMFVEISTPEADHLIHYKVVDKQTDSSKIKLAYKASRVSGGNMDWMLHTVRNRQQLQDWIEPPMPMDNLKLELSILPVERKLGKFYFNGFSYQYRYECPSLPIYKILDRGSWEIGGDVRGNTFWMRNGVVDPITTFTSNEQFYSTEWYLPGIANPNIFQFHPLQTALQGFTFTVATEGILVTWPSRVAHIRSLFEKRRGKSDLFHFHEHCNDLASTLETSPVEVLFLKGKFPQYIQANVYNQIRELVHEALHQEIGMRRERINTYGVIEEWTEPDFERYTYNGLPKLLDAGVKTVFIPSQCENVMNTWGLSNMCCNVDFKISKLVGEDKLKAFCDVAKASGARVEMWGNTALSTLTELFSHRDGYKKGIDFLPYEGSIMEVIDHAESPWVRNPSNAIEADHYTPRFCALNLRDKDIRSYWMKQWRHFFEHIGIGGIFLDSSFNMSSDKFHFRQWPESQNWHGATLDSEFSVQYRPAQEPPKLIHTQYHAHLSWVVEMQKMGYQYCAEDLGVFGINRTGPDVKDRITSIHLWQDAYCDFNEKQVKEAGYEPMDIFFKGLAYRMVWKLYWDIKSDQLRLGIEDQRAYQLLKIFAEVEPFLYHREILEDDKGVVYRNNGKQVLWCFQGMSFPLSKRERIKNFVTGRIVKGTTVKGEKNHVYLIG